MKNPPPFQEIYYINFNDTSNNSIKLFVEFGIFSLLIFINLLYFTFAPQNTNIPENFVCWHYFYTDGKAAGYFNGGFLLCLLITFVLNYQTFSKIIMKKIKSKSKTRNKIYKLKLGKNVTIYNPSNLYNCFIDDNSFKFGPFVEIQGDVKIGKNCRIQSHSFICEKTRIMMITLFHGVVFVNDLFKNGKRSYGDKKMERN